MSRKPDDSPTYDRNSVRAFLRENRALWMVPMVLVGILAVLTGALLFLGPGRAPFMYSLF